MRNSSALIFTFIEVVIALAIFAISFTAILGISATASARIARSQREWADAHRTAQAAEYFLLVRGAADEIPREIFPYEDCKAYFRIKEPQALPDGLEASYFGWRLASCEITLQDKSGRIISSIVVEKIIRENDN